MAQKARLLTTEAAAWETEHSILPGRDLLPAWTDHFWLGLRTNPMVSFAYGM